MSQRIKIAHVTTIDATLRFLLLNQLKAVQREGFIVAGVSSPGPWARELEEMGIRHYPVPSLNRRRNPLSDIRALGELMRLFRRERFAIVHTHMPKSGVLGRVAARFVGTPIVVNTVHGVYGIDGGSAVRRSFHLSLERIGAWVSDFEFCQSREIFDLFARVGIFQPDRSAHLGNGIDLEHFDPAAVGAGAVARLRAELEIAPTAPVVGTVGRLAWDKGYREFIAAATQVRALRPDVVFIAIGPPEERDPLPAPLIQQAKAAGVRFLGLRTDMRELYSLMDVFVLASYREGFPRSAIEAAAMEKAMVLSDIPGCREVVEHGRNGFLVPPRQVEPLMRAILCLLDDRPLSERFGAESRRRARVEFDERDVAARVLRVYKDLLLKKEMPSHGIRAQSAARR